MSIELERSEASLLRTAINANVLGFCGDSERRQRLQRHTDELRNVLGIYSQNGSPNALTIDNVYVPIARAALQYWAWGEQARRHDATPDELESELNEAGNLLHRLHQTQLEASGKAKAESI